MPAFAPLTFPPSIRQTLPDPQAVYEAHHGYDYGIYDFCPNGKCFKLIQEISTRNPYGGRCAFAEGAVDGNWRAFYTSVTVQGDLQDKIETSLSTLTYGAYPALAVTTLLQGGRRQIDMAKMILDTIPFTATGKDSFPVEGFIRIHRNIGALLPGAPNRATLSAYAVSLHPSRPEVSDGLFKKLLGVPQYTPLKVYLEKPIVTAVGVAYLRMRAIDVPAVTLKPRATEGGKTAAAPGGAGSESGLARSAARAVSQSGILIFSSGEVAGQVDAAGKELRCRRRFEIFTSGTSGFELEVEE